MVDVGVLPGFIAVILLFLVPPGPDMAFMTAVGLEGGRRSALRAILGIGTGMSAYAVAVVLGVGEIAEAHPHALDVVKLLGATYLAWLAYVTVRGARRAADGPGAGSTERPYLRGVLVSLTNPKILLFFLAVLPQFIGGAQDTRAQLAMLGAVNVATEVLLYGAIGLLAGGLHARFSGSRRAGAVLSHVAAVVYLALAGVVVAEVLMS